MARIRTIKPHFFTDEHLSALPAETQLLAAGLLCYADDEGYFNANPKLVEAAVFPTRELSLSTHGMLSELCSVGYIEFADGPDGRKYGRIINFATHQRINRPTPSAINKLQLSWSTHPQLSESSLQKNVGIRNKEGNKEGEVSEQPPPPENEIPIPEGLHELQYASRIIDDLGLVETRGLVQVVGAAVVTAAKRNKTSKAQGFEWLRKRALDVHAEGVPINRFWFEDVEKWGIVNADDGIARQVAGAHDF